MHVYIITNNVNGKIYVGKTVLKDIQYYLRKKLDTARKYESNHQTYLFRAMRKYTGTEDWSIFSVMRLSTNEGLCVLEKELIASLRTRNPKVGYNLREGGQGGGHSEETKRKISLSRIGNKWGVGRTFTPEQKRKMSEVKKSYANSLTPEQRSAHSKKGWNARRAKGLDKPTPEAKEKQRQSMLAYWASKRENKETK